MSRSVPLLATAALVVSVWAVPGAAMATALSHSVAAGHALAAGGQLRSANGAYLLTVHPGGDLTIGTRGKTVWRTSTRGRSPHLDIRRDGDVRLVSLGRILWQTSTRGSSPANRLTMGDDGALELTSPAGLVWSGKLRNGCRTTSAAHQVTVVISTQLARFCSAGQQQLISHVTTGASSLGYGTPTGTWRVQAKVRDTVLYPAAGGAFPVRYWVPYDGVYGLHDSSWQRFPYGSAQYRTAGSHGCVHVPATVMAWFFMWAPVGTTVSVRA